MIRDTREGVVLDVRVIPRAGTTRVCGERDGALLVRLAAPPVEDAANDALVALLSRLLRAPRQGIRVLRGARGRRKSVAIAGLSAAEVRSLVTGVSK